MGIWEVIVKTRVAFSQIIESEVGYIQFDFIICFNTHSSNKESNIQNETLI